MILPMKKLTLLVLDSEKQAALKILRNFGAVHIEKEAAASETLTELQGQYTKLLQAETLINDAKPKKSGKDAANNRTFSSEALFAEVDEVLQFKAEQSDCIAAITKLTGDIETYAPWGNFEPDDIRNLAEKGIFLTAAELS